MNINTLNNSLFTVTSPTHSRLSADSLSTRSSPLNQKDNWNLRDLQMKMKKGVRKEVSAASMTEQLKVFFSLQKGAALMKLILILAVSSLLYYATSMEGALGFTFLLLIFSELFCTTVFSFTDVNLVKNVRRVQPLIYCSIFYSCLKSMTGIKKNEIDWKQTFIAVVATLAHQILHFYKPFLNITAKKVITKVIQQKSLIAKLFMFPRYLNERIQATLKITHHLILAIGIFYVFAVSLFIIFRIFSFGIFQPRLIFYSFPLFMVLQCYFILLDYINMTFCLDLRICRVIKDRIPVLINLLRLQNNAFNRMVQSQCIKCVFMKVEKETDFLATQTIKSLLYGTYMDIFNQFSMIQLERIENLIQQHLTKIKRNDKVMKVKKSLLEDLLIYFKKIFTLFQSEWQASKIMDQLVSMNFVFLIINKIENAASDQQVKISRRVVGLTNNIKQRVKQCSQCISLSSYTQKQLANYYQNLRSESTEI